MFYRSSMGYDVGAQIKANHAEAEAERYRETAGSMVLDIERLLMITEALWTMMKEQHGYSDDELFKRVMEIDMRDGKLDGKVAATEPVQCPKCSRPIPKRRPVCIYCGTPVKTDLFQR